MLILWLKQSGLGLPAKDYYLDEEVIQLYSEVIENVLIQIFTSLNERTSGVSKLAKEVVQFEIDLAEISLDA